MSGTSTVQLLLSSVCTDAVIPATKSAAGWFWYFVGLFWSGYGLLILLGLILWVIFELITRNKGIHYDSDNGFSPTFNKVVGSGTFLLFQAITTFVLEKIFGNSIYCNPFAYVINFFVFIATGGFLVATGFWVYWRFLGQKPRKR